MGLRVLRLYWKWILNEAHGVVRYTVKLVVSASSLIGASKLMLGMLMALHRWYVSFSYLYPNSITRRKMGGWKYASYY